MLNPLLLALLNHS